MHVMLRLLSVLTSENLRLCHRQTQATTTKGSDDAVANKVISSGTQTVDSATLPLRKTIFRKGLLPELESTTASPLSSDSSMLQTVLQRLPSLLSPFTAAPIREVVGADLLHRLRVRVPGLVVRRRVKHYLEPLDLHARLLANLHGPCPHAAIAPRVESDVAAVPRHLVAERSHPHPVDEPGAPVWAPVEAVDGPLGPGNGRGGVERCAYNRVAVAGEGRLVRVLDVRVRIPGQDFNVGLLHSLNMLVVAVSKEGGTCTRVARVRANMRTDTKR